MAPGMMTKRFSALILIILLCGSGLCLPLFCENGKWVIAAQKFQMDSGLASDAVNTKTAEMLPSDILEKIGNSVVRNVYPDEQLERTKYKLLTERQSLFLQLSAEYKKRDALVLSNYTKFKLNSALAESKKKIKAIQKKIDDNLEAEKKAQEDYEKNIEKLNSKNQKNNSDSEFTRYKELFKNIFKKDESLIQQEQISFYKDDFNSLYTPSKELADLELTDALYKNAVVKAGINTLLTGHFSKYGEYISVYVDMYSYPSGKNIGSVAEVGSVSELEFVTNSIAMKLVPLLSNSMPVELQLTMNPAEAAAKADIYIDDALQKIESEKLIIDSGLHTIQFICDGYKTAGTTFNFEGNKSYKIEVNFAEPNTGVLQVALKKPLEGDLLMNGERALKVDETRSQIYINGQIVLGEFINEEGETAFFYIPEKLNFDGSKVVINPKPMDRMAYIDKRRKIMYTSYSVFIMSLIPMFYTNANFKNYVELYNNDQTDFKTAKNWQTATNVTRAVSIGCGIFWGYELVRYLIAANTVLPQNARVDKHSDFVYYVPEETPPEKNNDNIEGMGETE